MAGSVHVLVVVPGDRPVDVVGRAMSRLGAQRRPPHEIRVIASRARLLETQRELLGTTGAPRFAALCERSGFSRDDILFSLRTLHAVELGESDTGTAAIDRLLDLLRTWSTAQNSSLTVVIANDAGAVGHLLHASLQIAGRVSDCLLVDELPARPRRAKPAQPVHVEVPILLWPAGEAVPHSYTMAVDSRVVERRRVVTPDVLRLDKRQLLASVGESPLRLPAMQFFWLYYLAALPGEWFPLAEVSAQFTTTRRHSVQLTQRLSDGRLRTLPVDLRRVYLQLFPMAEDKFDAMFHRACGPHPGLPSTISKINAVIRRTLGGGAAPYLIQGGRGAGGYRLNLPPSVIQIVSSDTRRT
jgi:hypothetical protein